MRDSKIKHGAYAQDREEALRVLGEDPKDFDALLESMKASWQPANGLEALPVKRLARKCLKSLLTEEIEAWQAAPDQDRESLLKTNAPYFRDSAIAKGKPESEVLLRREDSSFRQIGRLTDLLLKLKREARQVQNSPMNIKNEGESHDVVDNKGRHFLSHDVIDSKAT